MINILVISTELLTISFSHIQLFNGFIEFHMKGIQKRQFFYNICKVRTGLFVFNIYTFMELLEHTHSVIQLKIFEEFVN